MSNDADTHGSDVACDVKNACEDRLAVNKSDTLYISNCLDTEIESNNRKEPLFDSESSATSEVADTHNRDEMVFNVSTIAVPDSKQVEGAGKEYLKKVPGWILAKENLVRERRIL